jgi:hypothetical protein
MISSLSCFALLSLLSDIVGAADRSTASAPPAFDLWGCQANLCPDSWLQFSDGYCNTMGRLVGGVMMERHQQHVPSFAKTLVGNSNDMCCSLSSRHSIDQKALKHNKKNRLEHPSNALVNGVNATEVNFSAVVNVGNNGMHHATGFTRAIPLWRGSRGRI